MSRWVKDDVRTKTLVEYLSDLDKSVCASLYDHDHFFSIGREKQPHIPPSLAVYDNDSVLRICVDFSDTKYSRFLETTDARYGKPNGKTTLALIASLTDQPMINFFNSQGILSGSIDISHSKFDQIFPLVIEASLAPLSPSAFVEEYVQPVAARAHVRSRSPFYFFSPRSVHDELPVPVVVVSSNDKPEENCFNKLRKAVFGC